MDDFFLPLRLRTENRLKEPGGNIHYERFVDEVVAGIRRGGRFRYKAFDCSRMDYGGIRTVEPQPLIVCEGTYSLHPRYADLFDIKIFVTCSPEEQERRIRARSGEERLGRFIGEWIPMEEQYFGACSISESCGFILDTESGL